MSRWEVKEDWRWAGEGSDGGLEVGREGREGGGCQAEKREDSVRVGKDENRC